MNLEKITSGDELVSLFPDKFNSNMDEIDEAVSQNAADISALDTRLTTAEGEIDTAQDDISALNTSLTHITDNGWSVIKFKDGTYEATLATPVSFAAGTQWGTTGFYYHMSVSAITLPSCSTKVTAVTATPYSAQLCWVVGTTALPNPSFSLYVANGTQPAATQYITFRITGTWT